MNKRLEWYIKSVLEYYTGEDSKYKGSVLWMGCSK